MFAIVSGSFSKIRSGDFVMSYPYWDSAPTYANAYLWPVLRREVVASGIVGEGKRAFDLGCGNGATCDMLSQLGFAVTGVDTSPSGVEQANLNFPHVNCHVGSAYDELVSLYGKFDVVVSLEVIEHCFNPRDFVKTFLGLMGPNSIGLISTPCHGYIKNLSLAMTGKMDKHFTALWDGGHIKFFSINTLGKLLRECGVDDVHFVRVGRIPPLAKSMVAVIRK